MKAQKKQCNTEAPGFGDDRLLTTTEAADLLRVTRTFLDLGRSRGTLPLRYVKIGRKVFYQVSAIKDFISRASVSPY